MARRAGAAFCAAAVLRLSTPALAQEGENDAPPSPEPPASAAAPAGSSAPPASPEPQPPPPWPPFGPPPPGWQPPAEHRGETPTPSGARKAGRGQAQVHDGFYFRLGFGIGLLHTASSFEGTVGSMPADRAIGDLSYSGHGLAVDGAIGGSPMQGLAIGYGFAWQIADDPTLTVEGTPSADGETERTEPLGTTIHGLFVDVFPNPKGNLEIGGLIGLGTVGTGDQASPSQGVAAAVWGGYGLWAGDELSLVALLRLSFAQTTSDYNRTQFGGPSGSSTMTEIERSDVTLTAGVVTGLLVH